MTKTSPPAEPVPETPPRWRYVGTIDRLYSSVPVTVRPGDVLEWPTAPAEDGMWEPTDAAATVVPDNAASGAPRIWAPDELAYGFTTGDGHPALVEDWKPEDRAARKAISGEQEVSGDA